MKLTRIFGVVLALHFAVVGALLVQPGCQTTTGQGSTKLTPASTASQMGGAPVNAPEPPPPAVREPPTRPAPEPTAAQASGGYNAGELLEPLGKQPETAAAAPEAAKASTYTVVKGDSLSKIARAHGVSVKALKEANHLTNDVIRVGQKLDVPAAPPEPPIKEPNGLRYEVKKGDVLGTIARNYQVSVADLKAANGLKNDIIRVGQMLVIPTGGSLLPSKPAGASTSTTHAATADGNTYTVQKGDVLGNIAHRFHVKLNDLMAVNGIQDPRSLRAGQVLKLPAGAQAPAASGKQNAVVREEAKMNATPTPAPSTPVPAPVQVKPAATTTVPQATTTPPATDPNLEILQGLGQEPETPTIQVNAEGDGGETPPADNAPTQSTTPPPASNNTPAQ